MSKSQALSPLKLRAFGRFESTATMKFSFAAAAAEEGEVRVSVDEGEDGSVELVGDDNDKDDEDKDDEVISVDDPAIFLSVHDSEEIKGFVETDSRRCSLAPTL